LVFQEEQGLMLNEYCSSEGTQAEREEWDTQESEFDPNNDHEGGEEGSTQIQFTDQIPSKRSLGKRGMEDSSFSFRIYEVLDRSILYD
jgi:hypothetical protein